MLKRIVLMTCFLAIACDGPAELDPVQESNGLSYEIRASNLKFSVSEEARHSLVQPKGDLDFAGLLEALNDVTGNGQYTSESDWSLNDTTDVYEVENDNALIKLDPSRMRVVVRDKKGYDVSEENETSAATDDENLIDLSETLISALGSTQYEFGDPQVRYLASWSREVDAAKGEKVDYSKYPLTKTRIARKAFFRRSIDDVEVNGDYMVVSFALDGTFRKMLGTWKPVDWSESILSVDITEAQYEQSLNDFLVNSNMVDIAEEYGVDATTCLEPSNTEYVQGPVTVELKGCATLFKSNGLGDGGGEYETHVFDLK